MLQAFSNRRDLKISERIEVIFEYPKNLVDFCDSKNASSIFSILKTLKVFTTARLGAKNKERTFLYVKKFALIFNIHSLSDFK